MKGATILAVLKQTGTEWVEDKVPMLGAALAYYTVFSLAPLLVISITVAGFLLGDAAARGQIFDEMRKLIGDDGGNAIQDIVLSAAASKTSTGIVMTIAGVVTLILGASGFSGSCRPASISSGASSRSRAGE